MDIFKQTNNLIENLTSEYDLFKVIQNFEKIQSQNLVTQQEFDQLIKSYHFKLVILCHKNAEKLNSTIKFGTFLLKSIGENIDTLKNSEILLEELTRFENSKTSICQTKDSIKDIKQEFEKIDNLIEEMKLLSISLKQKLNIDLAKSKNRCNELFTQNSGISQSNQTKNIFSNELVHDSRKSLLSNLNSYLFGSNGIQKLKAKRSFIITGSAEENVIRQILKQLFLIENYDSLKPNITNDSFEIYIENNLYKNSFDKAYFRDQCKNITKKGLDFIICVENLNPRPETLVEDINKLIEAFDKDECKKKIILIFTSSCKRSLEEIRSLFKEANNKVVSELMINDIEEFVNNRIWYLDEKDHSSLIDLKNIIFKK